jgi:hypothetical protein
MKKKLLSLSIRSGATDAELFDIPFAKMSEKYMIFFMIA